MRSTSNLFVIPQGPLLNVNSYHEILPKTKGTFNACLYLLVAIRPLVSNLNQMIQLGLYQVPLSWWRHQMETFSALLAICAGNSPVTDEFRAQRHVTPSFDVFFELRLNKRFRKQTWGWWFETPSCSLWCHRDDYSYQYVKYTWFYGLKTDDQQGRGLLRTFCWSTFQFTIIFWHGFRLCKRKPGFQFLAK